MNHADSSNQLSLQKNINELNNNFDSNESLINTFLKIIGQWPLKSEIIKNIEYQYWINDEAFNWYLLASRIIASVKHQQNIKKFHVNPQIHIYMTYFEKNNYVCDRDDVFDKNIHDNHYIQKVNFLLLDMNLNNKYNS